MRVLNYSWAGSPGAVRHGACHAWRATGHKLWFCQGVSIKHQDTHWVQCTLVGKTEITGQHEQLCPKCSVKIFKVEGWFFWSDFVP